MKHKIPPVEPYELPCGCFLRVCDDGGLDQLTCENHLTFPAPRCGECHAELPPGREDYSACDACFRQAANRLAALPYQKAAPPLHALVAYPFQLRPSVWVYLKLPADFNSADCERLIVMLRSLAVDPA
jgi:hypothetical protein